MKNVTTLITGVFVVCVLLSCSRGLDSSEIYVLDLEHLRAKDEDGSVLPPENTPYKLSRDDVQRSEDILRDFVTQFNSKGTDSDTIPLGRYGRQYVGSRSPAGEIVVFVYCFCDPESFKNKDKDLVVAFDGGICYFELTMNLTTKKYYDFKMNFRA